jgi:transcriptional regulator with XRE-family HTH domain
MELKRLRKERALSIRELSQVSGVATFTINQAERGLREPQGRTLRKLAKALNVEPIDILGGDRDPKGTVPDSSHLGDGDRRFVVGLDGLCDYLDRKLRAGGLTPDEIEGERAVYDTLAPLLARAMREEADELRKLLPDADDVSPWAVVGPRVARYTALVMQLIDAAELRRAHEEAYRLAS